VEPDPTNSLALGATGTPENFNTDKTVYRFGSNTALAADTNYVFYMYLDAHTDAADTTTNSAASTNYDPTFSIDGAATATSAGHLVDATLSPFIASHVGRIVRNVTDGTCTET
jgi:hypothetical protein